MIDLVRIFQVSDLAGAARREFLTRAKTSGASLRDTDGTMLVMLPEAEVAALREIQDVGPPSGPPRFRVLVHRKFLDLWNVLAERVGNGRQRGAAEQAERYGGLSREARQNAQQFWDHVAMAPGQPAPVGTTTVLRGRQHGPKWPGYSRTVHYEITGAGRIDYQYASATTEGDAGDLHAVVKILTISPGGH